jgi:thiamine biosynthesis lipoprotein ApbE
LGLLVRMSVTVVAKNCLTCDPLTKVVAVLGPDKGMPIIDEADGASAFMVHKTDKGLETFQSKRFRDVPQKTKEK